MLEGDKQRAAVGEGMLREQAPSYMVSLGRRGQTSWVSADAWLAARKYI